MSAIFKFEATSIRTLGNAETPLFVAVDVAVALGYKNPKVAASQHVAPEDIIKIEIDTAGGKQTVNCVNESGLYALIFGSKLESAKRFKRWVTSEVLPAIRKTGRYEAPTTITPAEQLQIQQAVARRAKTSSANYQTIYRAIKVRFQIPRYTELPTRQFAECLKFIDAVDLKVPEAKKAAAPKQEPQGTAKEREAEPHPAQYSGREEDVPGQRRLPRKAAHLCLLLAASLPGRSGTLLQLPEADEIPARAEVRRGHHGLQPLFGGRLSGQTRLCSQRP